MSNEQWTPGPWDAIVPPARAVNDGVDVTHYQVMSDRTRGQLRKDGYTQYREDPSNVDNVDITGMVFLWDLPLDEGQANANLIASAPDLYEALQTMLDEAAHLAGFSPNTERKVLAAMAKARGETQ